MLCMVTFFLLLFSVRGWKKFKIQTKAGFSSTYLWCGFYAVQGGSIFSLSMKSDIMTIQIKAIEQQYFHAVLFILFYKVFLMI